MADVTLEKVNQNINNLRLEIIELKARFDEEYEHSEQTKKDLEEARKQMKEEFVNHDEIMKRYG